MKLMKLTIAVLLVSFISVYAQNYSYNYDEMTQEQYNAELEKWKSRLATAEQGISDEDARIASLKAELESLNQEIDATWNEIYATASSDKAGNDAYVSDLNKLKSDVNSFLGMSPEDIYSRMNELDDFAAKVEELKKNDLSTLTANEKLLGQIESLINQAREKGKTAVPPSYTVTRGDYLWKIAAKEDIYGDAYAWMRIYTSNSDQIKDPNLIFPDQVLTIPRVVGPNEYLVQKGENLSMIAGYSNVYGSSFKWQKLFESNKGTISDPNVIYPYQLLKIER
ncbi:MAG TPA: LysM peptidoglycan-binding domain-containing protein [Caldithrix abyssi]|uniref:LysM peptidoglycan-binding domain-containing protein n=1 Tax=Caldithrix abyssi TaxID=187145 RepID=A0A7V1PTJ4_CALAY|nr:LysM peptidoglycan-binding domain-containing protein [Caldithrix abyssi]